MSQVLSQGGSRCWQSDHDWIYLGGRITKGIYFRRICSIVRTLAVALAWPGLALPLTRGSSSTAAVLDDHRWPRHGTLTVRY